MPYIEPFDVNDRSNSTAPAAPDIVRDLSPKIRIAHNVDIGPFRTNKNLQWAGGDSEPDINGADDWVANGELTVYLSYLGAEQWYMVGRAQENQGRAVWDNKVGGWVQLQAYRSRYLPNAKYPGGVNDSDPLAIEAAAGVVAMSANPRKYCPLIKAANRVPIIMDIEGAWSLDTRGDDPDYSKRIAGWTDRLQTYRKVMGSNDFPLFAYMLHGFTYGRELAAHLVEADARMMRMLTGFVAGGYNVYGIPYTNNMWFDAVAGLVGHVEYRYPWHRRNFWLTVSPYYPYPYDGQVVPLGLWKEQTDFAAGLGLNLFIWASDRHRLGPVREHVEYAMRYQGYRPNWQ